MSRVSLLLWDVGGVVLSNAWDHANRAAAAHRFGLDASGLESRHERVEEAFEGGRLDLAGYLSATVFDATRSFPPEEFWAFMRGCSTANPAALDCARALRAEGRYVMATLNNESRELNEYRIATFHLRDAFHLFLSSCYTGRRKPDPRAYEYALQVTQREPDEALFLDDRRENVEAASRLGLRTLWVRDPGHLREDLASEGIAAA
ncbi:MAG: HAD-IA family hydrolase [Thermoplasmata archaeon]